MKPITNNLRGPIFQGYRLCVIEDMDWVGVSIGIHISSWRIDIHILKWIINLGRVPIYNDPHWNKPIAVSNSYHASWQEVLRKRRDKLPESKQHWYGRLRR